MINLGINPLVGAKMVATANPTFPSAFNSITNIVFAYGGHVAWLSFISEFREPRDYPKALIALQSVDISLYLVAAVVIYCYAGDGVASPALSSNAGVVKKISWGIALPTVSLIFSKRFRNPTPFTCSYADEFRLSLPVSSLPTSQQSTSTSVCSPGPSTSTAAASSQQAPGSASESDSGLSRGSLPSPSPTSATCSPSSPPSSPHGSPTVSPASCGSTSTKEGGSPTGRRSAFPSSTSYSSSWVSSSVAPDSTHPERNCMKAPAAASGPAPTTPSKGNSLSGLFFLPSLF